MSQVESYIIKLDIDSSRYSAGINRVLELNNKIRENQKDLIEINNRADKLNNKYEAQLKKLNTAQNEYNKLLETSDKRTQGFKNSQSMMLKNIEALQRSLSLTNKSLIANRNSFNYVLEDINHLETSSKKANRAAKELGQTLANNSARLNKTTYTDPLARAKELRGNMPPSMVVSTSEGGQRTGQWSHLNKLLNNSKTIATYQEAYIKQSQELLSGKGMRGGSLVDLDKGQIKSLKIRLNNLGKLIEATNVNNEPLERFFAKNAKALPMLQERLANLGSSKTKGFTASDLRSQAQALNRVAGGNIGSPMVVQTKVADLSKYVSKVKELRSVTSQMYRDGKLSANAYFGMGNMKEQTRDISRATNALKTYKEQALISWDAMKRLVAVQFMHKGLSGIYNQFTQALEEAKKLDKAIAEIETISQKHVLPKAEWKERILDLSSKYGLEHGDVSKAAYETISNQIAEGADTFLFLESAAQLATASVSDLTDTVNLLSSVLQSYNMSASQTSYVSALMFKTVDLGRVTVEEMSSSFGRLSVLSSKLGVSLEEILQIVSHLTIKGAKYNEVATWMRNLMTSMMKPNKGMKQFLAEIGATSGEAAIKARGLLNVIKLIAEKAKDSSELAKLFPNIRGLTAALGLANKEEIANLERLKKEYNNSVVDYQRAVGIVLETPSRQLSIEFTKIKNEFIRWGDSFNTKVATISTDIFKLSDATIFLTKKVVQLGIAYTAVKLGSSFGTILRNDVISWDLRTKMTERFFRLNNSNISATKLKWVSLGRSITRSISSVLMNPVFLGTVGVTAFQMWMDAGKNAVHALSEQLDAVQAKAEENARQIQENLAKNARAFDDFLDSLYKPERLEIAEKLIQLNKELAAVNVNIGEQSTTISNIVERAIQAYENYKSRITQINNDIASQFKEIDNIIKKSKEGVFERSMRFDNNEEKRAKLVDRYNEKMAAGEYEEAEELAKRLFDDYADASDKATDAAKDYNKEIDNTIDKMEDLDEKIKDVSKQMRKIGRGKDHDEEYDDLRREKIRLEKEKSDLARQKSDLINKREKSEKDSKSFKEAAEGMSKNIELTEGKQIDKKRQQIEESEKEKAAIEETQKAQEKGIIKLKELYKEYAKTMKDGTPEEVQDYINKLYEAAKESGAESDILSELSMQVTALSAQLTIKARILEATKQQIDAETELNRKQSEAEEAYKSKSDEVSDLATKSENSKAKIEKIKILINDAIEKGTVLGEKLFYSGDRKLDTSVVKEVNKLVEKYKLNKMSDGITPTFGVSETIFSNQVMPLFRDLLDQFLKKPTTELLKELDLLGMVVGVNVGEWRGDPKEIRSMAEQFIILGSSLQNYFKDTEAYNKAANELARTDNLITKLTPKMDKIAQENTLKELVIQLNKLIINAPKKESLKPKKESKKESIDESIDEPEGYAFGGFIRSGTDTVPAMLTPGEFVVNREATNKFYSKLVALNSNRVKGYANGGVVTVGDININMTPTGNTQVDVKSIASELKRQIKRGAITLN